MRGIARGLVVDADMCLSWWWAKDRGYMPKFNTESKQGHNLVVKSSAGHHSWGSTFESMVGEPVPTFNFKTVRKNRRCKQRALLTWRTINGKLFTKTWRLTQRHPQQPWIFLHFLGGWSAILGSPSWSWGKKPDPCEDSEMKAKIEALAKQTRRWS